MREAPSSFSTKVTLKVKREKGDACPELLDKLETGKHKARRSVRIDWPAAIVDGAGGGDKISGLWK